MEEIFSLSIESLNSSGEGVGTWKGRPLYVPGALPQERVEVQLTAQRDRSASALLLRVLQPSLDRVEPPCPLFGRCGGCQWMHWAYPKQLEAKRQSVVAAFRKENLNIESVTAPCLPCEPSLFYRNKIQFPCVNGPDGLQLGLYALSSHDLVDVPTCFVHHRLGEEVYQVVRKLLLESSLKAYDPKTKIGSLRHLLIKSAVQTQEVLVVLVTQQPPDPELRRVSQAIRSLCPQVQGVVHNLQDQVSNVILGKTFTVLEGKETIEEELCGYRFQISAASFFQTNPKQAEKLYQQALAFAELKGNETVLDAYCGVGTLSLIFARKAKEVIGVEWVAEAVQNAQENAKRNGIQNVSFFCALSEELIQTVPKADVIVLNPPRKGCDSSFLKGIARLAPKKIIYISCHPDSLARDVAQLVHLFGYQVSALQPVDLFPHTSHVECVVQLKRVDN